MLYIYGELLCNFQTCAMVSSCVLTKLAWMQICAMVSLCVIAKLARMHMCGRMSSCVIAKLAWMQIYANLNLWVSAILAQTGSSIGLFVAWPKIDTRYFRKHVQITCRAVYFVDLVQDVAQILVFK